MRVLFYTATAFFIVLAGVFALYALQGPEHSGGAKVVLSIDSREAPGGAISSAEKPERDLYAEAAARLKNLETGKIRGSLGGEDVAAADVDNDRLAAAAPDQQDAGNVDQREDASSQAAQGAPDAKDESEEIPDPPPGTALAGLDDDKPLFKNIEKDEDAADASNLTSTAAETALPGTQLEADPAPQDEQRLASTNAEREVATAERERTQSVNADGLRLRQDSAADDTSATEGGQKQNLDAILAALNEREGPAETAASAPAGPPPPLPLRRSTAKTAAVNGGWSNTKITTTDAAALKPARIAILLRGIGRDDRNSSDAVTKLPPAISLAFMPFAGLAQQWAKKASEQGHEVIVQLPLEPSDYPVNNPGPETLLSSSSADQNTSRLRTVLARFDGYSGVTNFLGGKMLQSKNALRPILEEIKSRGLIYVGEGNNNSHAVVRGLAGEVGLRYGGANVMIDAQPTPAAIQAALARLIEIARKEGSAIGLGYGSRGTIEQLEAWTQTLAAQGVTLVPVGTLAQTPGAS
jgi:polysaccharide deacetylase 2 family uncharacterized protein YibQ